MRVILNIETSTDVCSAAISRDGVTINETTLMEGPSHASSLTAIIEKLFEDDGMPSIKDLDAVAVSSGPGSYTGLRIGVSAAKGICYALNIPLISVGSLQVLAAGINFSNNGSTLLAPMIDARRMEVYSALFDQNLELTTPVEALIITPESFEQALDKNTVIFAGNGASKCKNIITHPNAIFIDDVHPLAKNMSKLSYQAFLRERFEDVAYFEPYYLKDFVATQPKNIVF